jgi:hypothetical protein
VPPQDHGKDLLTGFILQHNHTPPAGWDGIIAGEQGVRRGSRGAGVRTGDTEDAAERLWHIRSPPPERGLFPGGSTSPGYTADGTRPPVATHHRVTPDLLSISGNVCAGCNNLRAKSAVPRELVPLAVRAVSACGQQTAMRKAVAGL